MFSTPHQTDYGDGYAGDDERSPYTFENVFDAQNSTPATPATPAAAAPPPSATTHGMLYRKWTSHQYLHRYQEDSSPANTSLFSTVSSRPTELRSSSASAHASPHDKWAPASSTALHDVLNDQESRSENLGLDILLGEPATPVLFGAATIADAIHRTSDGQPGADQIAHAFPQLHLGSPAVIDQPRPPLVNVFESHDAEQITSESDMDDTFDGDGIPEAPDVHEMDVYTNLNEDQRSIAERCAAHLAEIPLELHDAGPYDRLEHMAGPGIDDWEMAQHDAAEQDGDSEEYLTGPDVTEGLVTEHDGNLEEGMHANAGMETDGYEVPEEFSQDTELVQDVIQALATFVPLPRPVKGSAQGHGASRAKVRQKAKSKDKKVKPEPIKWTHADKATLRRLSRIYDREREKQAAAANKVLKRTKVSDKVKWTILLCRAIMDKHFPGRTAHAVKKKATEDLGVKFSTTCPKRERKLKATKATKEQDRAEAAALAQQSGGSGSGN